MTFDKLGKNGKTYLIVGGIVLALIVVFFTLKISVGNHVITLEEDINTAKADISKEEQRRVDLFNNLVDSIEDYNNYEQATMDKIVEARAKASTGNVDSAEKVLNVVVEQYPELKSQENYKTAMKEFSITENRLAGYRSDFNGSVRTYNQYTRKFPNSFFLNLNGYEKLHYDYLDFKVDNNESRNLFKK